MLKNNWKFEQNIQSANDQQQINTTSLYCTAYKMNHQLVSNTQFLAK